MLLLFLGKGISNFINFDDYAYFTHSERFRDWRCKFY